MNCQRRLGRNYKLGGYMAKASAFNDLTPIARMLDMCIREKLADQYTQTIYAEIDALITKLKQEIRETVEKEVEIVTLKELKRSKDHFHFADRLLAVVLVNPKEGEIIHKPETEL
jgi:hypothetical protein